MSQPNAKREASAAMAMSSNERPYAGAPFRKVHWAPRDIEVERRRNGEIVLRSRVPMQAPAPHLPHWLSHWAAEHPERTWLAQRRDAGPTAGGADLARVCVGEPGPCQAQAPVRPGRPCAGGGPGRPDFSAGAGQLEETLRNLREIAPTLYGNVPAGFAALAVRSCGERIVFYTGWGFTETGPTSTGTYWDTERVGLIGLPFPGVALKLVPLPQPGQYELRLKGPNVMPGYYRRPDLTAAAFDEEGFYKICDAGSLVDPEDPTPGLVFGGRVSEDFKLTTGTFVNVGPLRTAAIAAASPLLLDALVAGQDRPYAGLLAWPQLEACRTLVDQAAASAADLVRDARVTDAVRSGKVCVTLDAPRQGLAVDAAHHIAFAQPIAWGQHLHHLRHRQAGGMHGLHQRCLGRQAERGAVAHAATRAAQDQALRSAVAVHRIEGPGLLGGASRQPLQPVHAGLARQQLAQTLGQGSGLVHRRGLDAGCHHRRIVPAPKSLCSRRRAAAGCRCSE